METGPFAQRGMASVGSDDKIRLDPDPPAGGRRQQSGYKPALDRKIAGLSLHLQLESRKSLGMIGEKVEEIPLRHKGNKPPMGGQMREVRYFDKLVSDLPPNPPASPIPP